MEWPSSLVKKPYRQWLTDTQEASSVDGYRTLLQGTKGHRLQACKNIEETATGIASKLRKALAMECEDYLRQLRREHRNLEADNLQMMEHQTMGLHIILDEFLTSAADKFCFHTTLHQGISREEVEFVRCLYERAFDTAPPRKVPSKWLLLLYRMAAAAQEIYHSMQRPDTCLAPEEKIWSAKDEQEKWKWDCAEMVALSQINNAHLLVSQTARRIFIPGIQSRIQVGLLLNRQFNGHEIRTVEK